MKKEIICTQKGCHIVQRRKVGSEIIFREFNIVKQLQEDIKMNRKFWIGG